MKNDLKLKSLPQHLFFLAILIAAGAAAIKILAPFQLTILSAFLSAYLCYPLYLFFKEKTRHSKTSVILVTVLFISVIVIPLFFVTKYLIGQISFFTAGYDFSPTTNPLLRFSFTSIPDSLFKSLPFKISPSFVAETNTFIENQLRNTGLWISGFFVGFLGWSVQMLTRLIIFLILFVSLLPHVESFQKFIRDTTPLKPALFDRYMSNISYVLQNVLLTSVLVAFAQAVITVIVFSILGIPAPLFFGLLMIIAGFIPFVGNLIISSAVAGLYIINGNLFVGLVILLVHFLILNNVDLVIRPLLQLHKTNLHVGLLLVGMFGGVLVLGAPGIIYGPIIMSILVTSLEVVQENYGGGKLLNQSEKISS